MADASPSRRWQVFLVLGLIACVASLYFLIGGGTFAAVSGLVTIAITLFNAFLSPATAKEGENWFVGAMKRTLVVGRYAKVVCVLLWIVAFINAGVLARAAHEKKYRVDIEGVVIDKLRGTPLEKALVTLKLADGASLSSDAPAGRFKFTALDRRKVVMGRADLEAVCEGVHGKVPVDLSKGSVTDVRIVLSVSLPPIKRMFFVLKGHAVDIFVRDKKLPTELEAKLGGNIALIDTPPFHELSALMDKFSGRSGREAGTLYDYDGDSETLDPQAREHVASVKKIEKEQLKRLANSRVLRAAAGQQNATELEFDGTKLPSSFFTNGSWSIECVEDLGELIAGKDHAKSGDRTSLEIALDMTVLRKFATRADFDALRAHFVPAIKSDFEVLRFLEHVSRNGMPPNFLLLSVGGCGNSLVPVTTTVPPLQLRVVVLENVTDKLVDLGNFHFRVAAPAAGERSLRTAQENAALFAGLDPKSEAWYAPRALRPGEKLVVPLELILNDSEAIDPTDPDEKQRQEEPLAGRPTGVAILRAHEEIQTVALVYDSRSKPLVRLQKQKFIDALLREEPRTTKADEFVYGPSIALDAIDVNGAPYPIEPFNPAYVSYFSGEGMGSCPFVYCRGGADSHWLRQGSILRGRKSKAREGTGELTVHGFDGTLRITEEEAEISYIDEISVRARSIAGENVTIAATDERLAHKDGHYVVLKKGESIDIKFAIPSGVRTDQVRVSASGYFEPTSPIRGR